MDRTALQAGSCDIELLLLISGMVSVASIVLVLLYRYRVIKTFDRLNEMVDDVIRGNFDEKVFDESRLSALESKFAHYLLASKLSANKLEEERNTIKELITDISHQTKTPMANIILYSELMLEGGWETQESDDLEALHQQALKLNFLISSLVKLSRLETGIITVNPVRNNTLVLVEYLFDQYEPLALQKGLYMKREVCGGTDNCLHGAVYDDKWTAEAVGNIVDNAIKYTQIGGITISVQPYELFCSIEITDTGIGIAEEELSKIFQRFYRSQSVSQTQGIGIGLYLAREIIAAQSGYIKVVSKPGQGTKFCVFLPKGI